VARVVRRCGVVMCRYSAPWFVPSLASTPETEGTADARERCAGRREVRVWWQRASSQLKAAMSGEEACRVRRAYE